MLNDGTGFKKVYMAAGFTDLQREIDGLARIIRFQFQLDPYNRNTLLLFCGKRTECIKEFLWEGDGFLLLYKRIENGNLRSSGKHYGTVPSVDVGGGDSGKVFNMYILVR